MESPYLNKTALLTALTTILFLSLRKLLKATCAVFNTDIQSITILVPLKLDLFFHLTKTTIKNCGAFSQTFYVAMMHYAVQQYSYPT